MQKSLAQVSTDVGDVKTIEDKETVIGDIFCQSFVKSYKINLILSNLFTPTIDSLLCRFKNVKAISIAGH